MNHASVDHSATGMEVVPEIPPHGHQAEVGVKRTPLKRRTPLRRRVGLRSRPGDRRHLAIVDDAYRAFVRSQGCLVAGRSCFGPVSAHHVGHHGCARENDYDCIPLCWGHHVEGPSAVHRIHQPAFEALYGVSFTVAIEGFNAAWVARNSKPNAAEFKEAA